MKEYGINCTINYKEKSLDNFVESAILKINTQSLLLKLFNKKFNLNPDKLTKIKFEIDMTDIVNGNILTMEYSYQDKFEISIYDEPSLFACKIAALLNRKWKNRPKR